MQIAGDSRAFRYPLVKSCVHLSAHLMEAEAVPPRQSKNERNDGSEAEQPGLVEVGFLCYWERDTGAIPYSTAVAGTNPENVPTDWNVGVHRGKRIVRIQPDRIYIIHPILEANLFGPCQRNRIKTKLDVMRAGWQNKFTAGRVPFSSNRHLINVNKGLSAVKGQVPQVEHCQSLYSSNPELAVGRHSHVRSADAALRRGHAIGSAKPRIIEGGLLDALVLSEGG